VILIVLSPIIGYPIIVNRTIEDLIILYLAVYYPENVDPVIEDPAIYHPTSLEFGNPITILTRALVLISNLSANPGPATLILPHTSVDGLHP